MAIGEGKRSCWGGPISLQGDTAIILMGPAAGWVREGTVLLCAVQPHLKHRVQVWVHQHKKGRELFLFNTLARVQGARAAVSDVGFGFCTWSQELDPTLLAGPVPRTTAHSRAAQEPSSPRPGPAPLCCPTAPLPGLPLQPAFDFFIFSAAKAVTNCSGFVSLLRPRRDLLWPRYREIRLHSQCFSGRTRSARCLFAPSLLISVTDPRWPRSVPNRPRSHFVPPAARRGQRGRTNGRRTNRRETQRCGGGKTRCKHRLTPVPPLQPTPRRSPTAAAGPGLPPAAGGGRCPRAVAGPGASSPAPGYKGAGPGRAAGAAGR